MQTKTKTRRPKAASTALKDVVLAVLRTAALAGGHGVVGKAGPLGVVAHEAIRHFYLWDLVPAGFEAALRDAAPNLSTRELARDFFADQMAEIVAGCLVEHFPSDPKGRRWKTSRLATQIGIGALAAVHRSQATSRALELATACAPFADMPGDLEAHAWLCEIRAQRGSIDPIGLARRGHELIAMARQINTSPGWANAVTSRPPKAAREKHVATQTGSTMKWHELADLLNNAVGNDQARALTGPMLRMQATRGDGRFGEVLRSLKVSGGVSREGAIELVHRERERHAGSARAT